jgi:hypothetical protein
MLTGTLLEPVPSFHKKHISLTSYIYSVKNYIGLLWKSWVSPAERNNILHLLILCAI